MTHQKKINLLTLTLVSERKKKQQKKREAEKGRRSRKKKIAAEKKSLRRKKILPREKEKLKIQEGSPFSRAGGLRGAQPPQCVPSDFFPFQQPHQSN